MEEIQQAYLFMLKVERQFSEHTLKSYHDDLEQFNVFLKQEYLELSAF
ncbi:MAG: site-specific integrase, partial [Staphylococcus equorum]|nr:site-specific integrase [Staphylococcus equorum]